MASEDPGQGWLSRGWNYAGDLKKSALELKPPEKLTLFLAAFLLTGVIYENLNAAVVYHPDIQTWAVIFDADMTAGLFIAAIVAAGFEFWKLRKPPEPRTNEWPATPPPSVP